MLGKELAYSPQLGELEKKYIRIFGAPICGLRIRLRRVFQVLDFDAASILDAGCGRGVFSYQLAKKYPDANVIGVDIDEQQLIQNTNISKRLNLRNLCFKKADVSDLPFEGEFDLVLSVDNLEHIEDDQAGLNSLFLSLKPGGTLVLHVPGYERRWLVWKFRENFDVPGHYRPGYIREELCEKIERTGFNIESSYYTFGWLETIANNLSYLITKAEAKNKIIYALIFPLLNGIAWLGRYAKPEKGAGILILAKRCTDKGQG